jgi:hypothetical protein
VNETQGPDLKAWPNTPVPAWLAAVTPEQMQDAPLPLKDVLDGALYYPSSAFDGTVIQYLASRVHSFVQVDYSLTREQLTEELLQRGFMGYRLLGRRAVTESELAPSGWKPLPLAPGDGRPTRAMPRGAPFCDWMVFERLPEFGEDHGPARFSLLHLHADGAAAFDALYRSNGLAPSVVAVIQPGHGFGGNWTNFKDPDAVLGRLVLGNPAGTPEWFLHGGIGGRRSYRKSCWPAYGVFHGFITEGQTNIAIWRRGVASADGANQ